MRPLALETGFLRPRPGQRRSSCCSPIRPGSRRSTTAPSTAPRLVLATDAVVRTSSAKEYVAGQRLYGLVEGDLLWTFDMAAAGQQLQPHIWARLQRS